MSFISFAQNLEDVMLWRALKSVEHGYYIDVGAGSPDVDSVTKAFYERGWRGINVEPHPDLYRDLVTSRPGDINLNVALGDRAGRMTMAFASHAPLSTVDEQRARALETAGMVARRALVPVETLATIWQDHVPHGQAVHFLKIDVEGYERQVLLGNTWQSNRPWIIAVEATLPETTRSSHASWEPILLDAGFEHAYADGLNRFYVAQEHDDLLTTFSSPPNVFDDFVRASEVDANERAARAEAALAALYASRSWRMTAPLRAGSGTVRTFRSWLIRAAEALRRRA